jgi:hypothetical protein
MIAVKRLQSLFWVLLVALGALGAYLVSLRVATERNELMKVRTQIAQARGDIRYLETEFDSRANMRQLEKWNADDFRYSALAADHYLEGERALAHLDGVQPNGPAFVSSPVMVAMVDKTEDAPAPVAPSPAVLQVRPDVAAAAAEKREPERAAVAKAPGAAPQQARLTLDSLAPRVKVRGDQKAKSPSSSTGGTTKPASAVPSVRKAERLAMLESHLLDDRTLREMTRAAAAEQSRAMR